MRSPPVFIGGPVREALERLSKSALIDILADRARQETGKGEDATPAEMAAMLAEWARVPLQVRGDPPFRAV